MPADLLSAFTAAEKMYVLPFASAAARDAKITSANARLGMLAWLDNPGMYTQLTTISGTTLTWTELAPRRYWYQGQKTLSVPNNTFTGAGAPPAMSGSPFTVGTNGPVAPVAGIYAAVLLVGWPSSPGSPAYVQIGLNGGTAFAKNADANNTVMSTSMLGFMNAGDEFTGAMGQNSGAALTATITWYVSRVSL